MKIFALLFYTKLQLQHNLINNSTIVRYDILTGLHNPLLTPKFNTRQHECQINICWQQQITQHSEIQQQHHNNNNNPSKNNIITTTTILAKTTTYYPTQSSATTITSLAKTK